MKYLGILFAFFSTCSFAGGWATPAVPTRIEIERGNGFMIYGAFGNAGGCTIPDRIYVEIDHPQYKEIYSTVLVAYMSGKKVEPYIHTCKTRSWYVTPEQTFNTLTSAGTLNLVGN